MGKVSIDLSSLKAAGIYTLEVDNSQRSTETTNALRMLVGFSNKGPFNRPVLLEQDVDRLTVFGDIDTKLEHKGCFFNRMLKTLLTNGPVIALNLLSVDETYDGPDQVNYAALSLDAAKENPAILTKHDKYCEYDYLAESVDNVIYGTVKGDSIPFVGDTPFASVYNRSRFWTPDKDLLTAAAARGLASVDFKEGDAVFEYTNFLNFANVGTEEFSILVFKPSNMSGYDVTAEQWYGGKENIPFGWVRPYDFISDYFIQVVCVKGNWTNYPVLATDPVWGAFFDKKGVIKDKVNQFMSAEGITVLGSWTGIIIPDFVDKQGNNLCIERRINAATERTGLLMSFNNDAANVLTYDYSGKDADESAPDQGCWGIDIDGTSEIEEAEVVAPYIIDMNGHGAFMEKEEQDVVVPTVVSLEDYTIAKNSSIKGTRSKTYVAAANLVLINGMDASVKVNGTINVSTGVFIDASVMRAFGTNAQDMDSSVLTENSLKRYITTESAYYVIQETGAPIAYNIQKDLMKMSYKYVPGVAVNNMPVVADILYSDVQCKLEFTVSVDASSHITAVNPATSIKVCETQKKGDLYYGINFLSYNYIQEEGDGVCENVYGAYYLSDITLWESESPLNDDVKNVIVITCNDERPAGNNWDDKYVKVGDYLQNITYKNEVGQTNQYKLIPGLSRVIKKQFYKVDNGILRYNNKNLKYVGPTGIAKNDSVGVYILTCTAPVLIENNTVVRQLPINADEISHSLRFIPVKGLALSSRHRPGYNNAGELDIEGGINKIYSVLEDEGIYRGLMNPAMVDYRYIIDSMSYGLDQEMGGKVYLSKIACDRGKCTAVLSLPSAKQFAVSTNPYFCKSYIPGVESRPSMNTKYIAEGGNTEMGSTRFFSLPNVDNGASFTACFWPNLIYTENGKTISVPPAADCANVLNRKFTGVNDPYCICANQAGILSNKYLTGLEFLADRTDREYLEPFGVNTIIKDQGVIMIYGNQTAYQSIKSDLNKLHVRENLNTAEIECEAILKKYNFLYNTAATRANIVAQLTPVLQVMQLSGALAKYEIICDETNNTADVIEADTCIVNINLWFNHGMEKIVQVFTINRYAALDGE